MQQQITSIRHDQINAESRLVVPSESMKSEASIELEQSIC